MVFVDAAARMVAHAPVVGGEGAVTTRAWASSNSCTARQSLQPRRAPGGGRGSPSDFLKVESIKTKLDEIDEQLEMPQHVDDDVSNKSDDGSRAGEKCEK